MYGRCSTLWKASHKAEHLPPRPTTPYPFGQIKHLAYKVEVNPIGLLYNYQVVGKHPAARFDSLIVRKPHPAQAGVRLPLHVYISMGGPWWGSRKARRFVVTPVCQPYFVPAHPFPSECRAIREVTGRSHHGASPPKINPLHVRLSTHSSTKSLRCRHSIYATGTWVNWIR